MKFHKELKFLQSIATANLKQQTTAKNVNSCIHNPLISGLLSVKYKGAHLIISQPYGTANGLFNNIKN